MGTIIFLDELNCWVIHKVMCYRYYVKQVSETLNSYSDWMRYGESVKHFSEYAASVALLPFLYHVHTASRLASFYFQYVTIIQQNASRLLCQMCSKDVAESVAKFPPASPFTATTATYRWQKRNSGEAALQSSPTSCILQQSSRRLCPQGASNTRLKTPVVKPVGAMGEAVSPRAGQSGVGVTLPAVVRRESRRSLEAKESKIGQVRFHILQSGGQ